MIIRPKTTKNPLKQQKQNKQPPPQKKTKTKKDKNKTNYADKITAESQKLVLANFIFIILCIYILWRGSWCNGYRRNRRKLCPEFKSWMRLIVFNIVLMPLRKVCIQLFYLWLGVNSRADSALQI